MYKYLLLVLFQTKLYTYPPGVSIKLYEIIISHLSLQYGDPKDYSGHTAGTIRKSVSKGLTTPHLCYDDCC